METKRSENRNSELWIEFENRTRMLVSMHDDAEVNEELLPNDINEMQPPKKTVQILDEEDENNRTSS